MGPRPSLCAVETWTNVEEAREAPQDLLGESRCHSKSPKDPGTKNLASCDVIVAKGPHPNSLLVETWDELEKTREGPEDELADSRCPSRSLEEEAKGDLKERLANSRCLSESSEEHGAWPSPLLEIEAARSRYSWTVITLTEGALTWTGNSPRSSRLWLSIIAKQLDQKPTGEEAKMKS